MRPAQVVGRESRHREHSTAPSIAIPARHSKRSAPRRRPRTRRRGIRRPALWPMSSTNGCRASRDRRLPIKYLSRSGRCRRADRSDRHRVGLLLDRILPKTSVHEAERGPGPEQPLLAASGPLASHAGQCRASARTGSRSSTTEARPDEVQFIGNQETHRLPPSPTARHAPFDG